MKQGLPILPLAVAAVAIGGLAALRERWREPEGAFADSASVSADVLAANSAGGPSPHATPARMDAGASDPTKPEALARDGTANSPTVTPLTNGNTDSSLAGASGYGENAASTANAKPQSPGEALVRQSIDRLGQYATLQAKLRHRGDVLGRQLLGTGVYRQTGAANDLRLRMELRMQATDRVTSHVQVADGRFLWTHSDVDGQATLYRLDLQRVRRAAEDRASEIASKEAKASENTASTTNVGENVAPGPLALMPGGLAALLRGLIDNTTLAAPQSAMLDATAVWRIEGKWRPEKLIELVAPQDREAFLHAAEIDPTKLPAHAPQQVVIELGQADLFPYRIEYVRRRGKKEKGGEPGSVQSLVTLELFDVQANVAIPEPTFQFSPAGRTFIDVTERWLR